MCSCQRSGLGVLAAVAVGVSTLLLSSVSFAVAVVNPVGPSSVVPSVAPANTTSLPLPVVPTTSLPPPVRADGTLAVGLELAQGSLRFEPPPPTVRPKTGRVRVRSIADRSVTPAAARSLPEVFFGLFSARSPARRLPDGTVQRVFDRRPVWVVHYVRVKGERQSGIVPRRTKAGSLRAAPTTTLDLSVFTDIVVVIDDGSAAEVLRSEYAS